MRVGIYDNNPIVGLSEAGKPEGIFVDLVEAIAALEAGTIEYVPGTLTEGRERLAAGHIAILPAVAPTPARARLYSFHAKPVLVSWQQLCARRGSNIRTLPDLTGKTLAIRVGSEQHLEATSPSGQGASQRAVPDRAQ